MFHLYLEWFGNTQQKHGADRYLIDRLEQCIALTTRIHQSNLCFGACWSSIWAMGTASQTYQQTWSYFSPVTALAIIGIIKNCTGLFLVEKLGWSNSIAGKCVPGMHQSQIWSIILYMVPWVPWGVISEHITGRKPWAPPGVKRMKNKSYLYDSPHGIYHFSMYITHMACGCRNISLDCF